MPIFFQQELDGDTRLGVWHIEEDAAFFQQRVEPQRQVSHPHKKRQHLAGRYLLQHLFADFPTALIRVADTRKPFLEDEAFHFSISHCADFAAAIVSRNRRVGIDIEVPSDKVERIRHKFLSAEEQALLRRFEADQLKGAGPAQTSMESAIQTEGFSLKAPNPELLTLLWSCKEAIFKWYGLGSVD
ncbi:MAG TPA: 4'-phosphopantetheinyl transferase superfamily protein, partial [Chitinophagaceae bacterium]|nr:4'-phosphopantetheinyl transferase superfamily protein [Chitinophagaceae bacterium]